MGLLSVSYSSCMAPYMSSEGQTVLQPKEQFHTDVALPQEMRGYLLINDSGHIHVVLRSFV